MKRETAEKIANKFEDLGRCLNDLTEISYEIEDKAERSKFRRSLAALMNDSYEKVLREVLLQYPEFDPDKDSESPFRGGY